EGERARIVTEHAPHARADFLDHARLQGKVSVERNVVVVGHWRFHTRSSYPAKAGYPVNTSGRVRTRGLWDTGSSAFADDDRREIRRQWQTRHLRKRLNAGDGTTEDQRVHVVRAFIGVHGLQVRGMAHHVILDLDAVAAVHVARHAGNIERLA